VAPQIELLQLRDDELGLAGLHVRGVSARGRLDHLRRAVDRGQASALEPLADERRRDAVPAADLEDPVVRLDVEPPDHALEALAHRVRRA
jgi:hypothetical protein